LAKTLLINPSYRDSYGSAKASIVDPIFPTLSLLTIAASAEERQHDVYILDLSYEQYDCKKVQDAVFRYKPDVVGVTATTPLFNQARDISVLVKAISKKILVIAGGAHVSALPYESLQESMLDAVVVGEGDATFAEIMDGKPFAGVLGIHFRDADGVIRRTSPRPFLQNLDELPMPAWHLYDSENYRNRVSRLLVKRPPATMAEFSRGCVYKCDFCASKNTMALGYRKKSPARCAEEVRRMYECGYREFLLADDIFTSDAAWALEVSEAIAETGVKMVWTCTNGIRVESADEKLFMAMRNAGCYRVAFGFESGNDEVLKRFGKGGKASLAKGREAVAAARAAGIDTAGFFMVGLSPDTESTMQQTIDYARTLPLDFLKFGIAIAFPGTPMFKEYRQKGLVRSYDWDEYFIYSEEPLFAHPNLSFQVVKKYMNRAYWRTVVANPAFVLRRVWRGIRTGEFFWDLYYFIRFFFSPSTSAATHSARYYSKESWPTFRFETNQITLYPARPAGNKISKEMVDGVQV
jgi:anaerobic magnesium-protoporphyrin IX monomethyl ester cyclase